MKPGKITAILVLLFLPAVVRGDEVDLTPVFNKICYFYGADAMVISRSNLSLLGDFDLVRMRGQNLVELFGRDDILLVNVKKRELHNSLEKLSENDIAKTFYNYKFKGKTDEEEIDWRSDGKFFFVGDELLQYDRLYTVLIEDSLLQEEKVRSVYETLSTGLKLK